MTRTIESFALWLRDAGPLVGLGVAVAVSYPLARFLRACERPAKSWREG